MPGYLHDTNIPVTEIDQDTLFRKVPDTAVGDDYEPPHLTVSASSQLPKPAWVRRLSL